MIRPYASLGVTLILASCSGSIDVDGHSIFDNWRLNANNLEMDMLGETDRYSLSFKSDSNFRMDGPDALSCRRQ